MTTHTTYNQRCQTQSINYTNLSFTIVNYCCKITRPCTLLTVRISDHLWVTILDSSQKRITNQHNKWHTSVYFSMLRSNVTGRHRGTKQKLVTECRHYNGWGRYPAPSLKWTSCPNHLHYNASHMLRCVFIVEYGIARFLCAMRVFDVRASSSSPRLPLCQISFLSRPPLLS